MIIMLMSLSLAAILAGAFVVFSRRPGSPNHRLDWLSKLEARRQQDFLSGPAALAAPEKVGEPEGIAPEDAIGESESSAGAS